MNKFTITTILILLAACGGEQAIPGVGPANISLNMEETVMQGDSVKVVFEVDNFSFDVGYVQLRVDEKDLQKLEVTEYELQDLAIGPHDIEVELFNDDGTSLAKESKTVYVKTPAPSIKITQPENEVNTTKVTLVVETSNFGEGTTNPGSIEAKVDGESVSLLDGKAELELEWGSHEITVKLVAPNGTEYTSTIKDIEVKPLVTADGLPNFTLWYPREGTRIKGNLMAVSLRFTNFSIGTPGAENRPNYGYMMFVIDDNRTIDEVTKATYTVRGTVRGLSKGNHTLKVKLLQNDGTPYGVEKSITFIAQTVTGKDTEHELAS